MTLAVKVALNTNTTNQPSQTMNFGLFQTERFADDNFKLDKNGRKVLKQKTLWEKEKLLLFPQCFQKTCSVDK